MQQAPPSIRVRPVSADCAIGGVALAEPAGPGQAGHPGRRSGSGQVAAGTGPVRPAEPGPALPGRVGFAGAGQCPGPQRRGWRGGHHPAAAARPGGGPGRVFVLDRDEDEDCPLWLPSQLGLLDHAVREAEARLLVIDPIMAFIDRSVLSMNDQSVRRLLFPLSRLAARHQCSVLLLRHLNKQRGGRSLYRGGGSIAFLGACRSGYLAGRDPANQANLCPGPAEEQPGAASAQPGLPDAATTRSERSERTLPACRRKFPERGTSGGNFRRKGRPC